MLQQKTHESECDTCGCQNHVVPCEQEDQTVPAGFQMDGQIEAHSNMRLLSHAQIAVIAFLYGIVSYTSDHKLSRVCTAITGNHLSTTGICTL